MEWKQIEQKWHEMAQRLQDVSAPIAPHNADMPRDTITRPAKRSMMPATATQQRSDTRTNDQRAGAVRAAV